MIQPPTYRTERAPEPAVVVNDHPIPVSALMSLLAVSRLMAAPRPLVDLLRIVVDAGREVIGADRGSVLLYDPLTRELHSLVSTGDDAIRMSIDQGTAGEAARTRRTMNVPDAYADPCFNPAFDEANGYRTRCLLSVPLIDLDDHLVGVLQFLNPARGRFDRTDETLVTVLASHAAVAIQRERLLEGRLVRIQMERDLAAARLIQQGTLLRVVPDVRGYVIAAFNRPADQTGGDVCDVIRTGPEDDAPVAILVADACGHGIAPTLSVVQVRAMLRIGLRLGASVVDMLGPIDKQLLQDLPDDQFVTAFLGCLNPIRHELEYHAAGQGPLLHFHGATDEVEWHGASTIPLGVALMPNRPEPRHMTIAPGDYVVLLTDGFYECCDVSGEAFGAERVAGIIARYKHAGARAALDALVYAVETFAEQTLQADDLTAVIIHRLPERVS